MSEAAIKVIALKEKDKMRFWRKVDKSAGPDSCWIWTGTKNKKGYGSIGIGGTNFRAHRVAWFITNGPIARKGNHNLCVCHKCDVPSCCNPAHLFLGTIAENVADCKLKGRISHGYSHGELNGNSKLTCAQVLEMRSLYAKGSTATAVAAQFCVSKVLVGHIIKRKLWRHI